MPLPPALLARLQKRGIVKQEEEVIAENYDKEPEKRPQFEENAAGAPGCPNRSNPFHVCVEFCYDHWGDGTPEYRLPERYIQQKNRMLANFPLPDNWVEVYDEGIARFYFWNKNTDEVCWYSPRHPRAIISDPAPRIAKEQAVALFGEPFNEEDNAARNRRQPHHNRRSDQSDRPRGGEKRKKGRDPMVEGGGDSADEDELAEMNNRDRLKRAKRKGIDPMDPAAYGDAPVGKWSDGLRVDQVTGADVTAGGPLFQQRPYPAPGAILRKQKPQED